MITEIRIMSCYMNEDKDSPTYGRVTSVFRLLSDKEFRTPVYHHLGFRLRKHDCLNKGDMTDGRHAIFCQLHPFVSAIVKVGSLALCLFNSGDGLTGCSVQLPKSPYRVSIVQEGKASQTVDSFIDYGQMRYTMATVNAHQRLLIEELSSATA